MTTQPNRTTFLSGRSRPALIGMVHVHALPGTPRATERVGEIAEHSVAQAKVLAEGGADAICLENMHDVPYLRRQVGPEIVSAMTAVCFAVRKEVSLPLGVQILAGANEAAMAVALAADMQFVRAENFVFAHVADEGMMDEASAGPLLRYRRMIGGDHIAIWADIKKKHSAHAITGDVDLAETAKAAVFFGADAVIVTGTATGEPAKVADVSAVANAIDAPVIVGSGVTPAQLPELAPHISGCIVGSHLKKGGCWQEDVDPERLRGFVGSLSRLRC